MPLKLTENKKSLITPLTYKHTPCLAETNGSKKEYYPSVLDKRGLHQIGDTVYFYTGAFISLGYSPDGVSKYYVCNNTQYHNPHTWTYDLTGGNVVDNEYVHSFTRTVYDTNNSILGAEYNHPDCPYTKSLTVDPNTSITKRGYNFNCWVENSNTYSNASSHSTQIDAYFSAKWTPITYNISYNGNNGTVNVNLGSSEFPLSYNIESSPITFGSPSSWDRRGYTFAGWSPATIPTGSIDDKTVYAQWSLNSYPIYYDANGGTVDPNITPNNPSSYTVLDSGTFVAPNNISRTDYEFIGWNTPSYGPNQIGPIYTYALWNMIRFNIYYDLDGGTNNSANPSTYTPSDLPIFFAIPTKTGYTFTRWSVPNISSENRGDVYTTAYWSVNEFMFIFTYSTLNYYEISVSSVRLQDPLPSSVSYTFMKSDGSSYPKIKNVISPGKLSATSDAQSCSAPMSSRYWVLNINYLDTNYYYLLSYSYYNTSRSLRLRDFKNYLIDGIISSLSTEALSSTVYVTVTYSFSIINDPNHEYELHFYTNAGFVRSGWTNSITSISGKMSDGSFSATAYFFGAAGSSLSVTFYLRDKTTDETLDTKGTYIVIPGSSSGGGSGSSE